jgi:hypothetical protein
VTEPAPQPVVQAAEAANTPPAEKVDLPAELALVPADCLLPPVFAAPGKKHDSISSYRIFVGRVGLR